MRRCTVHAPFHLPEQAAAAGCQSKRGTDQITKAGFPHQSKALEFLNFFEFPKDFRSGGPVRGPDWGILGAGPGPVPQTGPGTGLGDLRGRSGGPVPGAGPGTGLGDLRGQSGVEKIHWIGS